MIVGDYIGFNCCSVTTMPNMCYSSFNLIFCIQYTLIPWNKKLIEVSSLPQSSILMSAEIKQYVYMTSAAVNKFKKGNT